jgi:hypothetical protein
VTDQPLTDAELQDRLRAAIAALGKSETELAALRTRHHLAHQARRAKEHQLDGIRRALCDIGVMQDDDPYSHADLEDVIRQAGRLDELTASVLDDLDAEADRADAYQPDPPIGCLTPDLPPGFGTVAPCVAPAEPAPSPLRDQIAAALYERERPPRDPAWPEAYAADREVFEAMADAVLAVILPAPYPAGLREQLAAPIDRILGDWPEHNRTDEHDAVRNELLEAVLAVIPPATRIAADRARNAETEVQRVVDLYERWVKAGPPPLGASMARWWDARLVELRKAILGTKDPS